MKRSPSRWDLAIERDPALLHRFQQRRLRLGRRAVDFIGEQDVAEDRPLRQRERAGLEVEEIRAHDVARHQIGRELDAPELEVEAAREALRKQRLGRAGRTFEQDMPAGEERDQHQIERVGLADDRLGDFLLDALGKRADAIKIHESYPFSTGTTCARP